MPAVPFDHVVSTAILVLRETMFFSRLAALRARVEDRIDSAGEDVLQVNRSLDLSFHLTREHDAGCWIAQPQAIEVEQLAHKGNEGHAGFACRRFCVPALPADDARDYFDLAGQHVVSFPRQARDLTL